MTDDGSTAALVDNDHGHFGEDFCVEDPVPLTDEENEALALKILADGGWFADSEAESEVPPPAKAKRSPRKDGPR